MLGRQQLGAGHAAGGYVHVGISRSPPYLRDPDQQPGCVLGRQHQQPALGTGRHVCRHRLGRRPRVRGVRRRGPGLLGSGHHLHQQRVGAVAHRLVCVGAVGRIALVRRAHRSQRGVLGQRHPWPVGIAVVGVVHRCVGRSRPLVCGRQQRGCQLLGQQRVWPVGPAGGCIHGGDSRGRP